MSAPLPRVYELGEGGKAIAVPPPPGTAGIIGGDFKGDELTRASKETVRCCFILFPTSFAVSGNGHSTLQ